MGRYFFIIVVLLNSTISLTTAQDIDALIEKVYRANLIQEANTDSLQNYRFKQKISFVKLDGDDEIDEQSRRLYEVYVKSNENRERKLISAENFEDGQWLDVTEKVSEKNEPGEGRKFSLNEMVGPEYRDKYKFTYIGLENVNNFSTIHIKSKCLEENEDFFHGDLWIHTDEYVVVRASLVPSEFPTGIETMRMDIGLNRVEGHWVPAQIHMDAEISFLFIFSGKIKSDILFYDYEFENDSDRETK